MQKIIFLAIIFSAVVLPIFPASAITFTNPLGVNTFEELLEAIINFVFWVGITLAPLMIIIAGFTYVTSGGSPDKVKKAKDLMLWAIIGLVILIAAKGLVQVIRSILGF